MSGYDLMKAFNRSLKFFWSGPDESDIPRARGHDVAAGSEPRKRASGAIWSRRSIPSPIAGREELVPMAAREAGGSLGRQESLSPAAFLPIEARSGFHPRVGRAAEGRCRGQRGGTARSAGKHRSRSVGGKEGRARCALLERGGRVRTARNSRRRSAGPRPASPQ